MSTARLWAFLAVALPVLAALIAPLPTVDLTYHLRAGAETLANGSIPTTDTWTFTAQGRPWVNQQWGAQIVLRVTELAGGWTGLAVLRAGLIAVIVGSLFAMARHRGLGARSAGLLSIAAFAVASPAMALRPQLLGMVCFVLVLLVLEWRHDRPRLVWLIPAIIAAWANVHGSFFLGVVIASLAWLQDVNEGRDQPHRLLAIAAMGAVAACLTPFGPGVWTYALSLSANPDVTARISEWQPTTLRTGPGVLFFASLAGLAVLVARRGRTLPWPTLAWLASFIALGLYTERGVAWWPLAATPVAATILAGEHRPERSERPGIRRVNGALAAVLVLVIVALLPTWRSTDPATGAPAGLLAYAPPEVTRALREVVEPGDHVLAEQAWSSWFEFAVPEARYAVDSRVELFPAEAWSTYVAILAGAEGWEGQLDGWAVDVIVIDLAQGLELERLEGAGWITRHRDDDGAVLSRP